MDRIDAEHQSRQIKLTESLAEADQDDCPYSGSAPLRRQWGRVISRYGRTKVEDTSTVITMGMRGDQLIPDFFWRPYNGGGQNYRRDFGGKSNPAV